MILKIYKSFYVMVVVLFTYNTFSFSAKSGEVFIENQQQAVTCESLSDILGKYMIQESAEKNMTPSDDFNTVFYQCNEGDNNQFFIDNTMNDMSASDFNQESQVVSKIETGKSYQCSDCKKIFSSRCNLKRHVNVVHLGIKKYSCLKCFKKFGQQRQLMHHLATIHNKNHKKNKKPNEKKEVEKQSTNNKKNDAFICEKCGKSFSQKGNLKRHEKSHARIKEYRCEICKKDFSQKQSLITHQQSKTHNKQVLAELKK